MSPLPYLVQVVPVNLPRRTHATLKIEKIKKEKLDEKTKGIVDHSHNENQTPARPAANHKALQKEEGWVSNLLYSQLINM